MKETLLLYQVQDSDYQKIDNLCKQLNINVKTIHTSEINETLGYLLNEMGYQKSSSKQHAELSQPLIFFAGMSEKQLDILLELLKMTAVQIPYKAMLTKHNIHYTFIELYQSIEEEYLQMTQNQ